MKKEFSKEDFLLEAHNILEQQPLTHQEMDDTAFAALSTPPEDVEEKLLQLRTYFHDRLQNGVLIPWLFEAINNEMDLRRLCAIREALIEESTTLTYEDAFTEEERKNMRRAVTHTLIHTIQDAYGEKSALRILPRESDISIDLKDRNKTENTAQFSFVASIVIKGHTSASFFSGTGTMDCTMMKGDANKK